MRTDNTARVDQLRANNAGLEAAPMRMQEPDVQAAGETSEGARA